MTRLRPVSLCASGRLALDDTLGNKLTVIGLAAGRLQRPHTPDEGVELLLMVLAAVAELEGFLRDLSPCRVCLSCSGEG